MNNLDKIISEHFKKYSTNRIIKIIESNKKNLDDETYELNRRLKLEGKTWKFDSDDKILITNI